MNHSTPLSAAALDRLLAISDLTEAHALGHHAIEQQANAVCDAALGVMPGLRAVWKRGARIARAAHNYHLLGYAPEDVVLSGAHTHWVDGERLLRTQTTSVVLEHLEQWKQAPVPSLVLAPGLVYRRDVRDRTHCGQPHQMDVWWLVPKDHEPVDPSAWLLGVMAQALPGVETQALATSHPYTRSGIEIQARWQDQWLEIGEGGLIDPALLERLGIDSAQWGGVASGWGLDRLVMVRKGLPDIRLLRDPLPAIARQMTHLGSWTEVSRQPTAVRELSLARPAGESEEALTELLLAALPDDAEACLQAVEMAGLWTASALPAVALQRLGLQEDQENRLVRLVWQSASHSIGRQEVNAWSRGLYRALHAGTAWAYCP